LVHRDIKPENILFQAGHPLVTDFGIAMVATEAQERLTQTGIAIGTLTYMSPEQIAGDREVDARTDVYALGCVLYEMLTGHAPFAGSTAQAMLAKKLLGGAPDLSDARADVPATVQAVLAHALTADPDRRLATASRFVEELTHATSAIAIEEAARRRRRRGALRLGAAGGAISAVALAGSWLAATLAAPDMERIAVLPLTNAANAPDQDFFIQGIHEDLVLELARAGMRVKSAGAVAQYAGTNRPVRDIATELAVEGVIQGSASHVGDSVTINLQLVDGETDELIWLESFAAHARDVVGLYRRATLAIADEIGLGVADELRLALSSAPASIRRRTRRCSRVASTTSASRKRACRLRSSTSSWHSSAIRSWPTPTWASQRCGSGAPRWASSRRRWRTARPAPRWPGPESSIRGSPACRASWPSD
jgi:serine/threonine-protein kinase